MREHQIEKVQKELRVNVHGEAVPLQMTLSLMRNELHENLGTVVVFDDMTAILNAQRAQAWTEVARRIAHEIKNPLTPIRLSAERLQRKFGDLAHDPAFLDCTSMIIRQTEELKNLVNEFTQFARLPELKPVLASLTHTVSEAVQVYESSHPAIQFVVQQDSDIPEFRFDPGQIHRALVNLLDNAVHALGGESSGRIEVTTSYNPDLRIVRVTVSDNGSGIPAENRARIFDPYFSTKESGTGLGLAIVRRVIEDHNGFIRVFSNEPERGTKFLIELPVNEVGAWKPVERSDTSSTWPSKS